MSIFTRYLFKEFVPPFLSGTLFFTVLFILQHLKKLSELIFEKNIPAPVVLELLLYTIPFTAAITIPMGTLFGTFFSLGRLSQDSEITILQASGVSLFRIFRPILVLGILITLFLFYFMSYIMTETNLRYKSIYINILYSNPGVVMPPKYFATFGEGSQKVSAFIIDKDGWMNHVFLYSMDNSKKVLKLIQADKGRWINNQFNSAELTLNLFDGEILQFRQGIDSPVERIKFESITVNVVNDIQSIDMASEGLREMSFWQIRNLIKSQLANNQPINPSIYIEYHRKFTIPLACLAFVVVSIPLAVSFRYRGKGVGLGVSLVVVFIYYSLMTTSEAMGKKEVIDPSWALHIPNIIFSIVGLVLMITQSRK